MQTLQNMIQQLILNQLLQQGYNHIPVKNSYSLEKIICSEKVTGVYQKIQISVQLSKIASKTINICQDIRITRKVSELSKICKYENIILQWFQIQENTFQISLIQVMFFRYFIKIKVKYEEQGKYSSKYKILPT